VESDRAGGKNANVLMQQQEHGSMLRCPQLLHEIISSGFILDKWAPTPESLRQTILTRLLLGIGTIEKVHLDWAVLEEVTD